MPARARDACGGTRKRSDALTDDRLATALAQPGGAKAHDQGVSGPGRQGLSGRPVVVARVHAFADASLAFEGANVSDVGALAGSHSGRSVRWHFHRHDWVRKQVAQPVGLRAVARKQVKAAVLIDVPDLDAVPSSGQVEDGCDGRTKPAASK